MPLSAKFEAPVAQSGLAISDVTFLNAKLDTIRGAGIVHYLNAVNAATEGDYTRVKDMANRNVEIISTYTPPPVKDTAINGVPTLTFGTGNVGTPGQKMRPKRYGNLDVGTGAWSMCMLVKATGAGSQDVIVGPESMANRTADHYSPYLRFAAAGGKTLALALVANDETTRHICLTHEFYNTDRVVMICQTPGVGIKWYVDNWSTPAAAATTDAAKAQTTDGKFVIGGPGWTLSSLTFAGSLSVFTAHNVDLSLNDPARRDLMKAIAAYGGITSN